MRRSARAGRRSLPVVLSLLVAALAVVALEPWHGPTVLSLSDEHGIDLADLPAPALLALALAILASRARRAGVRASGGPAGLAAVALGLVLACGLLFPRVGAPLVPAGGGTFDGRAEHVSGVRAEPVGQWTHLAVTYDGAAVRLYVDGAEASSRPASGAIRTTADPLWIGGNHPYGEHFRGVLDEVQVYDRALRPAELRDAMATSVAGTGRAAAGLVAAYTFAAEHGRTVPDASGHGNTGTMQGARWTPAGRFGGGMSFEGPADLVRVPASPSLDLGAAMTLTAWVMPSEPQSGWRTVVARQDDAYTLMAGGGRQEAVRLELLDGLRFALVLLLAGCIGWAVSRGHPLWAPGRRRWYPAVGLFAAGSLLDVALEPSNAVIALALVAAWWGATSSERDERRAMYAIASLFAAVSAVSIADPTTTLLPYDDGGVVRAAALGLLLMTAGVLQLRRHGRASAAAPSTLV